MYEVLYFEAKWLSNVKFVIGYHLGYNEERLYAELNVYADCIIDMYLKGLGERRVVLW